MFLLHWFDLQRDYIEFYTSETTPEFNTTGQARSKTDNNPHQKPVQVKRERPEPAQRTDHWKDGQSYPGYPYFIGELFPAFGLSVHPTRLPNGIQHQTCGMKSARDFKVGSIATIEYEVQMETQVTEFLKEKKAGLEKIESVRQQVRAGMMKSWGQAEAKNAFARQAEASSSTHRAEADSPPATRRASTQKHRK